MGDQARCRVLSFNVNGLRAVLRRLYGPNATISHLLNDVGRDADIVCLQETKLRRSELAISPELALADGWESFFSCANSARGYSGTATFCRATRALPFAAEEGLSGRSAPPSHGTTGGASTAYEVHADLQEDFSSEELQSLDSEGRVVATDHGAFVLYNLYGPAITSDDPAQARARMAFKMRFYAALQRRWEGLLARGRPLLVVGDLNVAPGQIDYPDVDPDFFRDSRPDRRWLRDLLGGGGGAKSDAAHGSAQQPFVDCFRCFHPHRRGAFTVWSTATGARENNYGSRIDLCLAAGLPVWPAPTAAAAAGPESGGSSLAAAATGAAPASAWVAASDIEPDVVGSDHCPVWVDVGHAAPFPCALAPPPGAARSMYAGTQTKLRQFFGSAAGGSCGNGRGSGSADVAEDSRDEAASGGANHVGDPKAQPRQQPQQARAGAASSAAAGTSKQASLRAFLQAPSTSARTAQSAPAATAPRPAVSGFVQAEVDAAAASREQGTATAKAAWQRIQQRMQVPRCAHGDPAALKRVTKSGPNHGRWFYACAKAQGQGAQAQCSFFRWVEGKAADSGGPWRGAADGGGGAAKKSKLQ